MQAAAFLDHWSWLVLAIAAPFLLFPSPSLSMVLLVIPVLWVAALIARRLPLPVTPLNGSILMIALMMLASLWASYDLVISLPKIAGMVLALGIYFAFSRYGQNMRGWWICLSIFLAVGAGMALVGLLGMDWTSKVRFLVPLTSRLSSRITGLPGAESGFHPNEVAGLLLWIVPVFVFLTAAWLSPRIKAPFHPSKRWLSKPLLALVLGGCTLICMVILLLTQSRGALLGLGGSLALMSMLLIPRRVRWYFAGCLVAAGVGGILILGRGSLEAAANHLFVDSLPQSGVPFTLNQRLEIWSRAILGIQLFPVTGMGMNTFRHILPVFFPLFTVSPSLDIGHAHNEFLQAALDLGIPGLVAFLGLYWGAFGMLVAVWKSLHKTTSPAQTTHFLLSPTFGKFMVAGLAGGLLAHLFYGLFDAIALGAKPGMLFWMLLGLIAGLYSMVAEKEILLTHKEVE